MNCNDDIEENHLGAGNEKKRDCPRRYDSVCKVPLKDAPGVVTFVCKHGFWIIPTGNCTICQIAKTPTFVNCRAYFVTIKFVSPPIERPTRT